MHDTLLDRPALAPGAAAVARLLLNTRETSAATGVCERTIFAETKAGRLRAVRIGRRVLYDVNDIREWIEAAKK